MGSISLPALDLKPIQQPDVLGQYSKLAQLRAMQQDAQQRASLYPIQQQTAQLQLEQEQRAANDQKALSAAMQEWAQPKSPKVSTSTGAITDPQTGEKITEGSPLTVEGPPGAGTQSASSGPMPNYDDLIALAKKHGASFNAIQGLQTSILNMKDKASSIVKNDAQTASNNANAMKVKNGMLTDAMTGVAALPDAQLAQGLLSASQQLAQQGLLDPQHVQMAQQLAQSGDPAEIRRALTTQIAGMGGFSKMIEDAQKAEDLKQKQGKADPNSPLYNPAPVDQQELNSYIKNNPGKTAQDFAAWKAKQSPMGLVLGNQLGGPQNGGQGNPALDFAADNYRKTGQMPPGLARSPGSTVAIIQRAAQMDQQEGGGGIAGNKAALKSYSDALNKLQTNFSQVQAFEQTAEKNMDLLQSTAQKIPDLGARFANVPVRMVSSSMIGTANMAAFKTALATAQTEAAKVLNSANATGTLSDSSRHELQDIIDGNAPLPALIASLNTLKQDMGNRTTAYQQQIGDLQNRIKNVGGSGQNSQPAGNSNDPFSQFGGKAH